MYLSHYSVYKYNHFNVSRQGLDIFLFVKYIYCKNKFSMVKIAGVKTVHKKRPGVIAKNKTSRVKSSKNYKKAYRGQGRA